VRGALSHVFETEATSEKIVQVVAKLDVDAEVEPDRNVSLCWGWHITTRVDLRISVVDRDGNTTMHEFGAPNNESICQPYGIFPHEVSITKHIKKVMLIVIEKMRQNPKYNTAAK